jgi:hypothetical protein
VFPGCLTVIDATRSYGDTLRRYGVGMTDEAWARAHLHGVTFDAEAMDR